MRYLVIYYGIFCLIALWAIFEKAYEPGWGALIPIYNSYQYFKITWGNGWYFLLLLIPFVNVIIAIITTFKLARSFGKSFWFGLGLLFLSAIFMGILAFGKPRYISVPGRDDSFDL
ncbi:MAG: hypothetical protein CVV04_07010 [Firmicutes bacterium HGW-Firmicutes-9]|nr:MAG: hypothetical protein CVV04_07010 [Firmicutes bacterium HGW-Firmicutes-9]